MVVLGRRVVDSLVTGLAGIIAVVVALVKSRSGEVGRRFGNRSVGTLSAWVGSRFAWVQAALVEIRSAWVGSRSALAESQSAKGEIRSVLAGSRSA